MNTDSKGAEPSPVCGWNLRADQCHSNLLADSTYNEALRFLAGMGLNANTIDQFNIGYDSDADSKLFNRVIIPVYDDSDNIAGFVSRTFTPGQEPIYLSDFADSSPRPLFGLNVALKSSADYFILCEGVFDVMLLHQNGFDSAVAITWTRLTEEQALSMAKYKKNVLIFFDNDNCGKSGALKAQKTLESCGINAKIMESNDIDPASMMKRPGGKIDLEYFIDAWKVSLP